MKILVTGDWEHVDFASIIAELASGATYRGLEQIATEDWPMPDLIVLAQARRQQFAPDDIERLRDRWPATPCVHLLSSWCEGEVRSGVPLSGWVRAYWHRWPDEFARFKRDRDAGRITSWDVGAAQQNGVVTWAGGRCMPVGLWSRGRSETLMIQDCLQWFGHTTRLFVADVDSGAPSEKVQACVIAGDSVDDWLRQSLQAARRVCRRGLKVVLLGFPRFQEVRELEKLAGKNLRVISKPFDAGLLQQALQARDSAGFAA